MTELAGRSYVPRLYRIARSRTPVVRLLLHAVEASGARVVSCTFPGELVAPIFLAAEDVAGHRYGLLIYPFTATRRPTRKRSDAEHRFQIRYGEPSRVRLESNPLGRDPSGVDVTLVVAVDPERDLVVGLDPLVYADLPMGTSGYYRDEQADSVAMRGWAAWAKEKEKPRSINGANWEGLESMVGLAPSRFLDFARFEALATGLGLDTGLRVALAQEFATGAVDRHDLERAFGIDATTILDIIEANFRLGVAVRGSVAEHHLGKVLASDPVVAWHKAIDRDGQPDFRVRLLDGRVLTIECKNALRDTYKEGDPKVEVQKTRDSGAGRKYAFGAFDITAACMFSVTGRWTFRFRWTRDLIPWKNEVTRIGAIQRIDEAWATSMTDLIG